MTDSVRIEVTDRSLGALKRIIDTLEAVYDVGDATLVIEAESREATKFNGSVLALRVETGEPAPPKDAEA